MHKRFYLAIFHLALIFASINASQLLALGAPPNIMHIQIEDNAPGEPLRFKAIITDDGAVKEALLYFRTPGKTIFDFVPFFTEYEFYIAEIPAEFLEAKIIEYYISVTDNEGETRTSPEIDPENTPYRYSITPLGKNQPTSIILLSPEPGSEVPKGPELIVISVFDPEDDTDLKSLRLMVDGRDVTVKAQITRDLITYLPTRELTLGKHSIEISAKDAAGNITPKQTFEFTVAEFKKPEISKTKWGLNFSEETRYDKFEGKEQPTNRPIDHNKPRLTGFADWGWLKVESELFYNYYLDDAARTDAQHRQTLDRYRLKLTTRPLTLTFGDANPRFSELTIKGTRVRGVTGDLKLGFFGLSAFVGESRNKVEPYSISAGDSVLVDSIVTSTDTVYIYQKETGSPTYKREAFGVRTTINFADNPEGAVNSAKLGFNYLRFKADLSDSASFYSDLVDIGGYQYAEMDSIEMRFYLLSLVPPIDPDSPEAEPYWEQWASQTQSVANKLGSPKDNIVFSTTLDFRLFKRTFLSFETALSVLNDDMYGDRSMIDSLIADQEAGEDISASDQQILDLDTYMGDYFNFEVNDALIHTFTPVGIIKPVLFADLRTPLPLIPTNLQLQYRRIPETYSSLGNPSIQTDISAIKADTRTNLYRNIFTMNVGGETKWDNLYYAKQVTTTNNTAIVGGGLMFPRWPMLNLSYRYNTREGIGKSAGQDSTFTDNNTSTITASVGYQFKKKKWQGNINLNSMLMTYSDNKNSSYDFDNNSYIFSLNLTPPLPINLDLGYGLSINAPKIASETNFTLINGQLSFFMYENRLTLYTGGDYLTGEKNDDDPDPAVTNGIDNQKISGKVGAKWKISKRMTTALELERIQMKDNIDNEESYDENRARFRFEWGL
jgi:hypothetical protein